MEWAMRWAVPKETAKRETMKSRLKGMRVTRMTMVKRPTAKAKALGKLKKSHSTS